MRVVGTADGWISSSGAVLVVCSGDFELRAAAATARLVFTDAGYSKVILEASAQFAASEVIAIDNCRQVVHHLRLLGLR